MKKIVVFAASTVLSTMILAVSAQATVISNSPSKSQVAPSASLFIDSNSQVAGPVQVPPPLNTIKFAPEVNVAGPVQVPPPLNTIKFAPVAASKLA